MTFPINKEYSKSAIKVPRNSAKTCPKLTKTSKWHDRHFYGIPVVNFGQMAHPVQCPWYIPWTSICVQSMPSINFQKCQEKKKTCTDCKSEKISEVDSASRNKS